MTQPKPIPLSVLEHVARDVPGAKEIEIGNIRGLSVSLAGCRLYLWPDGNAKIVGDAEFDALALYQILKLVFKRESAKALGERLGFSDTTQETQDKIRDDNTDEWP